MGSGRERGRQAGRRRLRRRALGGVLVLILGVVAVAVALNRSAPPEVPVAAEAPPAAPASPTQVTPSSAAPNPAPSPSPLPEWSPAPEESGTGDDVLVPDFDVLDPVELDEEARFEDGVRARIATIERDEVRAKGPGESAGEGVLVTVEIENTTREDISLDAVVVDIYDDDGVPAVVSYGDSRTTEFAGDVAPGRTARATYVARLAGATQSLTLIVSYEPGAPAVSFTGKM